MSAISEYLVVVGWLLTFLVAPFALGVGICRALRVKEFSARLSWVLFSAFLALAHLEHGSQRPVALALVRGILGQQRSDRRSPVVGEGTTRARSAFRSCCIQLS